MFSNFFFDSRTVFCFEYGSLKWQPEKMHQFMPMPKNYRKAFENGRKIERRSILDERERERKT